MVKLVLDSAWSISLRCNSNSYIHIIILWRSYWVMLWNFRNWSTQNLNISEPIKAKLHAIDNVWEYSMWGKMDRPKLCFDVGLSVFAWNLTTPLFLHFSVLVSPESAQWKQLRVDDTTYKPKQCNLSQYSAFRVWISCRLNCGPHSPENSFLAPRVEIAARNKFFSYFY